MRRIANVVFAGDRYIFACKRHQLRVLRRGRRFAVDREEDGAIVAKDDERRAIFCTCLGARYADGLVKTLGVGACRITQPETVMTLPVSAATAKQAIPIVVDARNLRYEPIIPLPRKLVLSVMESVRSQ